MLVIRTRNAWLGGLIALLHGRQAHQGLAACSSGASESSSAPPPPASQPELHAQPKEPGPDDCCQVCNKRLACTLSRLPAALLGLDTAVCAPLQLVAPDRSRLPLQNACATCVWIVYNEELKKWRAQVEALVSCRPPKQPQPLAPS